MLSLWLSRYYTPTAVLGELLVTDGADELFECVTIERSWQDNLVSESCIPEGNYELRRRRSGVVERTTGGEYLEGWEVTGVPGRTYIMIHPANYADQLEGCIAPGAEIPERRMMVTRSGDTFRGLMKHLAGEDACRLVITQNITNARV